ncbi:redoxin domain-containing protein [candidate division KSB1 bacterium]|nr:redoxin domain-containing protein [candidate division KSB1 bacterium]RQW07940.1 MAG: redoxin [candidate division KSB1 bacterium]
MHIIFFFLIMLLSWSSLNAAEVRPLAIDSKAPDFKLPATDGEIYSLASFKSADVLVIIFTANHCPTAQAYEDKIMKMVDDYAQRGVAFVAISSNHPDAVRLDELGYSDLGDSFAEMKIRAADKKFNFPYLYDGDEQEIALRYGPTATPHVFIFDKERRLRYQGRIDDTENPYIAPTSSDAINAIEALLAGVPAPVETTKVFGCSMKWRDKVEWAKKADADWAALPVSVEMIDSSGVAQLVKNESKNVRLINVWATWCGPCVVEFPELVKINRMYRGRNFEFITISADKPTQAEQVLKFLTGKEAANKNYHFDSTDVYALIDAVDAEWAGALPYTIIVAPGGKVIYRHMGLIDPLQVKRAIVGQLGRYYADNE